MKSRGALLCMSGCCAPFLALHLIPLHWPYVPIAVSEEVRTLLQNRVTASQGIGGDPNGWVKNTILFEVRCMPRVLAG